jgi:hypothetical protein
MDKSGVKGRRKYRQFVEEGLRREIRDPLKGVIGRIALGGETFWEEVRNWVQGLQGGDEVPAFREVHRKTDVGVIVEKVALFYGIPVDRIMQLEHPPYRGTQVAMYLARKKTDLSLKEIAAIFGKRHYRAVSVAFRRVEAKRQGDLGFDRELGKIERELSCGPVGKSNVSCQDLTPSSKKYRIAQSNPLNEGEIGSACGIFRVDV